MPDDVGFSDVQCFNPRPAKWPGDAASIRCSADHGFNPRPANWPGDAVRLRCHLSGVFQSAPGRGPGDAGSSRSRWPDAPGFNPRPANWPGDAPAICAATIRVRVMMPVSIRARPIGRAMPADPDRRLATGFNPRPANWPGDAAGSRQPGPCFNPRPADWPGDAHARADRCVDALIVSIRARPIGRAMR